MTDKIILTEAQKRQHIQFWSYQFEEHAQFIGQLTHDRGISREAESLANMWHVFVQGGSDYSLGYLLKKLKNLIEQAAVTDARLPPNDWADLLKHMDEEQDYFVKRLDDNLTQEEEVAFWAKETAEHTQLLMDALKPQTAYEQSIIKKKRRSTLELIDDLKAMSQDFTYHLQFEGDPEEAIQATDMVIDNMKKSDKGANQILEQLKSGQLKALITKQMIQHEARESTQGKHILKQIMDTNVD